MNRKPKTIDELISDLNSERLGPPIWVRKSKIHNSVAIITIYGPIILPKVTLILGHPWQTKFRGKLSRNPILNQVAIQGPGGRRTLVWETTAGNGVAVIEKIGDEKRGRFVDVKIRDKPFKVVVAAVKRNYTLERKRAEREERLC